MNSLNLVSFNCNSIVHQHREFADFLQQHNVDVALLQETFLKPNNDFKIANYRIFRTDREGHGGGTAIIIKNSIKAQQLNIKLKNIECTAASLDTPAGKFQLVSVYASPAKILLAQDLKQLFRGDAPTIAAGDYNAKHGDWSVGTENTAGRTLKRFLEKNPSIDLHAPSVPTRYASNCNKSSTLDICLTKKIPNAINIQVLHELHSDHLPILIQLNDIRTITQQKSEYITSKSHDWKEFINIMTNQTYNTDINNIEDLEEAACALERDISEALQATKKRPKRARFVDNSLPESIRNIIKKRNKYRKLSNNTGHPWYKQEVGRLRHEIRSEIRAHRRKTWSNFVSEQTEKNPYAIPSLIKKKRKDVPTLKVGDLLATSDDEKAEMFAKSLEAKYKPNDPIDPEYEDQCDNTYNSVKNHIIGPENRQPPEVKNPTIKAAISRLKNKKAPGLDGCTNLVLKLLPEETISRIRIIFNAVLKLQYFPETWKKAKIILIPKAGKIHTNPANYRPIHLLKGISKLFERIFVEFLVEYMDENKVLPDFQFGFRREHSTTMQLLRVTKSIADSFNDKYLTSMVLMDMESAFDKVNHRILIHKLVEKGIPAYAVKLILSYLTGRSFELIVGDSAPWGGKIEAGVPQGSVLGPHLFNILMNDIPRPSDPRIQVNEYADDINISCTSKIARHVEIALQEYVDEVVDFLELSGMNINPSKTELITFSPVRRKKGFRYPEITINDTPITNKSEVRYLGLILDEHLSFKPHVEHVLTRAKKAYAVIRPVLQHLDVDERVKIRLYKQYLLPIITYAAPAWATVVPKSTIKPLQLYQNRKLRECLRAGRRTRIDVLHNLSSAFPILEQVDRLCANFAAAMANSENPINQTTLIPTNTRKTYKNPIFPILQLISE